MAGQLLGYARVSTLDQDPALQTVALDAAGCYRVWTDKASGKLDSRPQLDRVLDQLRPGDTLVVWRLDRLGRSMKHLIEVVTDLADREIGFVSLNEQIDTSTPVGKLVFHIFGALAEFESDLIRERTVAGLEAARARGRKGGRRKVMTPEKLRVARAMYDSKEHRVETIAQTIGVSRSALYRAFAEDDAQKAAERERDRRDGEAAVSSFIEKSPTGS